jgi:hypothetical protein
LAFFDRVVSDFETKVLGQFYNLFEIVGSGRLKEEYYLEATTIVAFDSRLETARQRTGSQDTEGLGLVKFLETHVVAVYAYKERGFSIITVFRYHPD